MKPTKAQEQSAVRETSHGNPEAFSLSELNREITRLEAMGDDITSRDANRLRECKGHRHNIRSARKDL